MAQFIIGSTDRAGNDFSVAVNPKVHHDQSLAETEAQRLARNNPSREFIVLKKVSSFVQVDVKKTSF